MARCSKCGITCDLKKELEIKHKGQIFCFCSSECKKRFEKERLKKVEKQMLEYTKQKQAEAAEMV